MASVASAQERGQGRGGAGGLAAGGAAAGGKLMLVQSEQVQQELKFTEEQKTKVGEISERVREATPHRGQDAAGQVDRQQQRQRMQALARVAEQEEKKLDEVLNEEQRKRLSQISLQQTGVRALTREEVASKLGLNDEQKQKIQAVLREQAGGAGRGEGQQPGDAAAMRERRQQTDQKILELLTAEQKQTWEELKGEQFRLQARGAAGQRRGGGADGERPGGERRRPQS